MDLSDAKFTCLLRLSKDWTVWCWKELWVRGEKNMGRVWTKSILVYECYPKFTYSPIVQGQPVLWSGSAEMASTVSHVSKEAASGSFKVREHLFLCHMSCPSRSIDGTKLNSPVLCMKAWERGEDLAAPLPSSLPPAQLEPHSSKLSPAHFHVLSALSQRLQPHSATL